MLSTVRAELATGPQPESQIPNPHYSSLFLSLWPSKAQQSLYVPPSGHYMYRQFNIQQFYVLPTQCIYVFCVDLRTNSDYFTVQH